MRVVLAGLVVMAIACGCRGDTKNELVLPPEEKSAAKEAVPKTKKAPAVAIHTTWRGFYHLSAPALGADMVAPDPRIIRDKAAFDDFIEGIPKRRVQKKQPAPPSDDLLLKRPPVDFERHMVLVAFRVDVLSSDMTFERFARKGSKLHIEVDYPSANGRNMMSRPSNVGAYVAIVVDRFDGDIVWVD